LAQVGGEFAISTAEQRRQIEALKVLEECLLALAGDEPTRYEGLAIRCGVRHADRLLAACAQLSVWLAVWLSGWLARRRCCCWSCVPPSRTRRILQRILLQSLRG
jgi:hypothetical protein